MVMLVAVVIVLSLVGIGEYLQFAKIMPILFIYLFISFHVYCTSTVTLTPFFLFLLFSCCPLLLLRFTMSRDATWELKAPTRGSEPSDTLEILTETLVHSSSDVSVIQGPSGESAKEGPEKNSSITDETDNTITVRIYLFFPLQVK